MTEVDISQKLVISRPVYLKDSDCGYCHGTKSLEDSTYLKSWLKSDDITKQHGTIGLSLLNCTPRQYDNLINKNFRRSGSFLYRADNLRNCCFYYTIRTNLHHFKLNKELRHDLNKFNKQLGFIRKNNGDKFELWDELTKFEKVTDIATDPATDNGFEIKFENGYSFTKYELFKKYQKNIHKDDSSVQGFKRFLIEHPFPKDGAIDDTDWTIREYGNVQLCYYYKKRLIGVSFLDILPTGVSSIYFIYDDDYKHLSLGKISILFEMLIMKRLGLEYLYLGYYIEDCPKMVYKCKFGGELWNPLTFEWVKLDQIDEVRETLEQKYGFDHFKETLTQAKSAINGEPLHYNTDFVLNKDKVNMEEIPLGILECTPITKLLNMRQTLQLDVLSFNELQNVSYYELQPRFQKVLLDLFRVLGHDLAGEVVLAL